MMISTKGRYALRVMLDLASHLDSGYIPLAEIAAPIRKAQHHAKTRKRRYSVVGPVRRPEHGASTRILSK